MIDFRRPWAWGIAALLLASPAFGQECVPEELLLTAAADSIQVFHRNADRNCCTGLTVGMTLIGQELTVIEGDEGDRCRCACCFDLRYTIRGLAAGRYSVRVESSSGSILAGEVDVPGPGGTPEIAWALRGDCTGPQPAEAATWGRVRAIYR